MNKNEQVYIKNQVVKAIGDPDPTVRRTAGSLITTIIGAYTCLVHGITLFRCWKYCGLGRCHSVLDQLVGPSGEECD